MDDSLKKIESGDRTVWITQPNEIENIIDKRETAFNIAKEKLTNEPDKIETAMQIAEAFGRGMFEEFINNKNSEEWTMEKWVKPIVGNIFNPMGTTATFTKITEDEAKSLIFRCQLHEDSKEPHIASLFTYGFLRGMLLSAFPDGELLMISNISEGAPMTEFIFKAKATDGDRLERERVKNSFEHITEKFKNSD